MKKKNLRQQLVELLEIHFPDYIFDAPNVTWNRAGHRQDNAAWQATGYHRTESSEITISFNDKSVTLQEQLRFRVYSFSPIAASIKTLKHCIAEKRSPIITNDCWAVEI